MASIEITTNGGYEGVLDTESGIVTLIKDVPRNRTEVGYVHLREKEYSAQEIEAIKEVTIRYFADAVNILSSVAMVSFGVVKRPWRPGEKEAKIKDLRAARIVPGTDEFSLESLFSGDTIFSSEQERESEIKKIEMTPEVAEYGDIQTRRLSLGGSFQRYFEDGSWLKKAEEIKGSKIYLA